MRRQVLVVSVVGAVLGMSTLAEADSRDGGDGGARNRCTTESTVDERCATALAMATAAGDAAAAISPVVTVSADQTDPAGPPGSALESDSTAAVSDTTATTAEPTTNGLPDADPSVTNPLATNPRVTKPPTTNTHVTSLSATNTPSVTDPPATASPVATPSVTTAAVTAAAVTDPPAPASPATDPPVVVPPVTDPPTTASPVTDPPTTSPPVTDPPVVVPSFTMSTTTPRVGELVTFDASAVQCPTGVACSYTWAWSWRSADGTTTHTGGQMGRTPTITYAFDAFAASKPFVTVLLTVGQGRVAPVQHAQATLTVSAT